jgi:hypothetical protein
MIGLLKFDEKQVNDYIFATNGKQEFRRTGFGSRLLAAEGEGGWGQRTGVGEGCV